MASQQESSHVKCSPQEADEQHETQVVVRRRVAKPDASVTPSKPRKAKRRLIFQSEEECLNVNKRGRQSMITSFFVSKDNNKPAISENPSVNNMNNTLEDGTIAATEDEHQIVERHEESITDTQIHICDDGVSSAIASSKLDVASLAQCYAVSPVRSSHWSSQFTSSSTTTKRYVTPIKSGGGDGDSCGAKSIHKNRAHAKDDRDYYVNNQDVDESPTHRSSPANITVVSPIKWPLIPPEVMDGGQSSTCDNEQDVYTTSNTVHAKCQDNNLLKRTFLVSQESCDEIEMGFEDGTDRCYTTIPNNSLLPSAKTNRPSRMANPTVADDTTTDNEPSFLHGLNTSQREAVTQPLYSITRVIAGPGAGKTRVLTCRIAYLLENDPRCRVLAVTFTRKAASEIRERVKNILAKQEKYSTVGGPQQDEPTISGKVAANEKNEPEENPKELYRATMGTFHSLCNSILHWYGKYLDSLPSVVQDMRGSDKETFLNGRFDIIDENEQTRVVRSCLKLLKVETKKKNEVKGILLAFPDIKAKNFANRFTTAAEETNSQVLPPESTVQKTYRLYRQKLLSSNMLDFDDLLYLTSDLLFVHPHIREKLKLRWNHILVDEFQDSSTLQIELVKSLTTSSLFVVGDADQCIYSWRGANVKSMSEFMIEFQGARTVCLLENYR